jgi:hypothetical protein
MNSQRQLLQVIRATHLPHSFASGFACRKQQRHQDADDGDDDEQFDEREAMSAKLVSHGMSIQWLS